MTRGRISLLLEVIMGQRMLLLMEVSIAMV
jgi:hypothetical protein